MRSDGWLSARTKKANDPSAPLASSNPTADQRGAWSPGLISRRDLSAERTGFKGAPRELRRSSSIAKAWSVSHEPATKPAVSSSAPAATTKLLDKARALRLNRRNIGAAAGAIVSPVASALNPLRPVMSGSYQALTGKRGDIFAAVQVSRVVGYLGAKLADATEQARRSVSEYFRDVADYGADAGGPVMAGVYASVPFTGAAVEKAARPYQDAVAQTAAEVRATPAFRQPGYLQNNAKDVDVIYERNLRNNKLTEESAHRVFKLVNKRMTEDRYEAAVIMQESFVSIWTGLFKTLWKMIEALYAWMKGLVYA